MYRRPSIGAGHGTIIELLLEAYISRAGERECIAGLSNALYASIRAGHGTIVELLLKAYISRAGESGCVGCLSKALYASAGAGHGTIVKLLLEPFMRRASERELVGGLQDALRASTANHRDIYKFLLQHTVRIVSPAALEEEDSQKVAVVLEGSSSDYKDNMVALGDEVSMWLYLGPAVENGE